jgi:2-polyprenyl-3-methyl-5-hydroxy-6-metoxy-1,4-benzoquinol methylase
MNTNQVTSLKVFNHFTDSYNCEHELLEGFRYYVKPGFKKVFESEIAKVPSHQECSSILAGWIQRVKIMERYLNSLGYSFRGKSVVEIGDSCGYAAHALMLVGASDVTATDITSFYESHKNHSLTLNQRVWHKIANLVSPNQSDKILFREDNICESSLDSDSADFIVSWEVLEHLSDPQNAFKHMERILKPGGFSFHEYNPFFALNGGHSLCTLDFPWGHVRLNQQDFLRYLSEIRPQEYQLASNFYINNLNRMTIENCKQFLHQAKLSIVSLIPWTNRQHLNFVDTKTIQQSQRNYPSVSSVDLLSPGVVIITQKSRTGQNLVEF